MAGLLSITLVWPFVAFEFPAMADYPNHLARVAMQLGQAHPGWQTYLEPNSLIFPNMASDQYAAVAHEWLGLSANQALKSFCALSLLLFAWGAIFLAWRNDSPPWYVLLVFPICFNRFLAWGFVNFLFSMGAAMVLLACWVRLRDHLNWRPTSVITQLAFILGTVGLMFSHMAGFGLFWVTVAGYELAIAARVARTPNALLHPWGLLTLALLVCVACYVGMVDRIDGMSAFARGWWARSKLAGLRAPFFSYQAAPAVLVGAGFVLSLGAAWRHWRINSAPTQQRILQFLPFLTGLAAFLALPFDLLGSYYLDQRLMPFIATIGLVCLHQPKNRIVIRLVCIGVLGAAAAKTYETAQAWRLNSRTLSEIRQDLRTLPERSRLATVAASTTGGLEFPPIRHAGLLGTMDRGLIAPNIFAFPYDNFQISFRKDSPIDGYFLHYNDVIGVMPKGYWERICVEYDYLLITGTQDLLTPPNCFSPITKGSFHSLWKTSRSTH